MTLKALVQRIHLWAGLLLGVQVLLWMASGAVMSVLSLDKVRGEDLAFAAPRPPLETETYASPGGIIAQTDGATSLELTHFLGRAVYITRGDKGSPGGATAMFDASTGARMSPLREALARDAARRDFVGEGAIVKADLLSFPPKEYRKETPVWRIEFNDKRHTRIYISPNTGEVLARRNDLWRLYDFFWMLHIMDYEERDNTNNILLIVASITGVVFAFSGVLIVVFRLSRGRYGNDLLWAAGKGKKRQDADRQ